MAHDYGSRDPAFVALVQHVRDSLLRVAGVTTQDGWESVIMQGSGTFCVESVLTTVLPRHGAKLLIIANGAYGRRMATMAEVLDIPHTLVNFSERTVRLASRVKQTNMNWDEMYYLVCTMRGGS